MAQSTKKLFTKKEANNALVLVGRITGDVVEKWQRILHGEDRHRKANIGNVQVKTHYRDLSETKLLIEDIQYHTMELAHIGCFFKDFNNGVVLFPAEFRGKKGYYMWQPGDPHVSEFFVPQKHYA